MHLGPIRQHHNYRRRKVPDFHECRAVSVLHPNLLTNGMRAGISASDRIAHSYISRSDYVASMRTMKQSGHFTEGRKAGVITEARRPSRGAWMLPSLVSEQRPA